MNMFYISEAISTDRIAVLDLEQHANVLSCSEEGGDV